MKCKDCDCCKQGWFLHLPSNTYACIGVNEPFVIKDINNECTEYEEKRVHTINKIKPDNVYVVQFDINDDSFDFSDTIEFFNRYVETIPKESVVVLMPNYMSIDSISKEDFKKFLDKAEDIYNTME